MAAPLYPIPRTVEEVFNDFKGRRAGLVKALTLDFRRFYRQCDPRMENLYLYGLPNETWELKPPVGEVPPGLPEPSLGINFARDGMLKIDWVSKVAIHSDSWLLSVAFYFGARFGFGKSDRMRLFQMISDCPTVYEEVKQGTSLCGACGDMYVDDEFWIHCDICDKWFHGKCAKITPLKAEHMKQYKCLTCRRNKRDWD